MLRSESRQLELDHDEFGGYLGLSHKLCNRSAAGVKSAIVTGKTLAGRPKAACVVCGIPIRPSRPAIVTCGRAGCVTELKRARHARQPDPVAPMASGRMW